MTALVVPRPLSVAEPPVAPVRSSCDPEVLSFPGRPGGVAVAPDGTVFVSDLSSGSIWRIAGGRAREVALGGPIEGATGAARERLLSPKGLALAPDGALLIADAEGHRVCALSATGRLRVVAGGAAGNRDGEGTGASFRSPSDVAIGGDGTCFVADRGNHRIRTIAPDGVVSTLAGSIYDYGDGRGPAARFRLPEGVSAGAGGSCYVADTGNNAVRRVSPDGEVGTVAGSPPGGPREGRSGPGLRWPTSIAGGRDGRLLVVDHGNHSLRWIDSDGEVTSWFALSERHFPVAVAVSARGEVVVAAMSLDDPLHPEACVFVESATG